MADGVDEGGMGSNRKMGPHILLGPKARAVALRERYIARTYGVSLVPISRLHPLPSPTAQAWTREARASQRGSNVWQWTCDREREGADLVRIETPTIGVRLSLKSHLTGALLSVPPRRST